MTSVIEGLPCLQYIYLNHNYLTEAGVSRLREMARPRPDLDLPMLDLQYPPGEDRIGLAYWQRQLARTQAVITQLKVWPGDWARDLRNLRIREQEADANIRRLTP